MARQDDVFAVDFGEPMHLHHAAAAHGIDMPLKGDDSAAVSPALADQKLEIAEQVLRELCPAFAGRDGDFNLHAAPKPKSAARNHDDGER